MKKNKGIKIAIIVLLVILILGGILLAYIYMGTNILKTDKQAFFNYISEEKQIGNILKEVSYSLVINKLKDIEEYVKDVKQGEGKIIEIDGQKVGASRNEKGELFLIKPYCSQLGCMLSWNNLDKTWDCPCHGSRFSYEGKQIYDPAIKDLEKYN